jgi:hypothetical protein
VASHHRPIASATPRAGSRIAPSLPFTPPA